MAPNIPISTDASIIFLFWARPGPGRGRARPGPCALLAHFDTLSLSRSIPFRPHPWDQKPTLALWSPRVALGPTLTLSSLGRQEFAKRMLFLSVIVAVVVAAIVVLVVAIVAINISVVIITIVVAMIVITLITITIIVAIVVVTIAVITTTVTCTIVTVIAPS